MKDLLERRKMIIFFMGKSYFILRIIYMLNFLPSIDVTKKGVNLKAFWK